MKNINPIGREPGDQKLCAYGCVCNEDLKNYASTSGNVPCGVCASTCAPGDLENNTANYNQSHFRATHT